MVGRQNADIADALHLRDVAMVTIFWPSMGYNFYNHFWDAICYNWFRWLQLWLYDS